MRGSFCPVEEEDYADGYQNGSAVSVVCELYALGSSSRGNLENRDAIVRIVVPLEVGPHGNVDVSVMELSGVDRNRMSSQAYYGVRFR